jgi:hypothetical protein
MHNLASDQYSVLDQNLDRLTNEENQECNIVTVLDTESKVSREPRDVSSGDICSVKQ